MAEVIEYRDILKKHRIKVVATNGNKTYASSEGYSNLKDARNTAINTSIQLLEFYNKDLSATQKQRIDALFYLMLEDND
jgi:hypothetical protein